MLFWYRVSKFFLFCGVASMVLGTADHVFGLGLWHGAYPPTTTDADGVSHASSYGEFMLAAGLTALVAFLLAAFLRSRLIKRAATAMALMELIHEEGYDEGRASMESLNDESPAPD